MPFKQIRASLSSQRAELSSGSFHNHLDISRIFQSYQFNLSTTHQHEESEAQSCLESACPQPSCLLDTFLSYLLIVGTFPNLLHFDWNKKKSLEKMSKDETNKCFGENLLHFISRLNCLFNLDETLLWNKMLHLQLKLKFISICFHWQLSPPN